MKIRGDIVRLYRNVHSWAGITAGLFLFIAFYAGGMTMFELPLGNWASQTSMLPAPVPAERLSELVQKAQASDPSMVANYTVVLRPDAASPSSLMWTTSSDRDHGPARTVYAGLAPDGSLVTQTRTPSQAMYFLNILHQRIGLPLNREYGRLVMGIVALLYAVALVSGTIVLLPSLVRNLFALRVNENLRRVWLDFHTLLGGCSLPFHIVMAASAAGFAFYQPIMALEKTLFLPAALSHQPGKDHVRTGQRPQTLLEPLEIVEAFHRQVPDLEPEALVYSSRGGKFSLRVTVQNKAQIARRPEGGYADVSPYTGRLTTTDFLPDHQTSAFQALTLIYALHFGTYGGWLVRWVYAVLGFGGAFLFYSGNQLWLSSRRRRERSEGLMSDSFGTRCLSVLTSGCMIGCVSGISAVLAAVPFLPEGGHYQTVEALFYAVLLGCLLVAVWLGGARSIVPLLVFAGVITFLIPIADMAHHLMSGSVSRLDLGLDGVALVYGSALMILALRKRPRQIMGADLTV
ncbi:peptidase [Gluconobacter japonicus]|nr:peptidase [Gluconobacter japonicus]